MLAARPLPSLVIEAGPRQLRSRSTFCWRGSGHVGPSVRSAHVFVCGSVCEIRRGTAERGEREAGGGAEQSRPLPLSPQPPHCFGFGNSRKDVCQRGRLPATRKQSYSCASSLISKNDAWKAMNWSRLMATGLL